MEELTSSWNNLSLNEREGSKFTLQNQHRSVEFIIATKFLTKRVLNMEVVANTFRPLWRSSEGFKMRKLDDHLVLFTFKKKEDLEQVFQSEPWCFDKHLVALRHYDQDVSINNLTFDRASFWVQVHDIPIRYMSREVAKSICDSVGVICHSIGGVEQDGGSFMRVKVTLDISLPLCRGRLITLENGNKHWVSFKYERLPNLCYWCGQLDHNDRDCPLWLRSKGSLTENDKQYNHTIRASPYRSYTKPVVFIPGFYESHDKPRLCGGGTENVQASVKFPSFPLVTDLNPTTARDTHEVTINDDVSLAASISRFDGDLTTDSQHKAVFPFSPAVIHHSSVTFDWPDVGGSSLGDAEPVPKISNPENLPKNSGTFVDGDPFLAKLKEIDRDIQKFDHVPGKNPGDLTASVSSLKRLGVARDKAEEKVDCPLPFGPQVNEPILPKSVTKLSSSRPPLQDLSNLNVLPVKLKPKQVNKQLRPTSSSHISPSSRVKKKREHSPVDISDSPVLKKRSRVHELLGLVKAKGPKILFLMETKKKKSYLERLRTFSLHNINAVVYPRIDDAWRFTGFYEAPEVANWEDSWSLLRHLSSQLDLPWVCIGDFNEITRLGEKSGGLIRPESQMQSFRECLDFCALKDLGFSGLPYTWSIRHFDGPIVWVRLDQALASSDWFQKYPTARLHHLPGFSSDHKPIGLCTDDVSSQFYRQLRPFRFEAMWVTDERCEQVVHSAWDMGSEFDPMTKVRKDLEKAEASSTAGEGSGRLTMLNEELQNLMSLEERMWSQRSKSDWLRYGDQNTKYFHYRASKRNKRNYIFGIENAGGILTEDESQIGDILRRFYSNMFSSDNPSVFDPVLSGVDSRVTEDMNTDLVRPFELSEIYVALHQMDSNTSPGPDGFPPLFYKKFWNKVGGEVSKAVLSVLNSGNIPNKLNHTFLTLIPKIHSPRKVSDFRPISLSNVLYKIIAKVLANRLKPLLPHLIFETQGVFLSERIITDNILIAHENLHYLKQKRTGKLGYMALKLDMSKAYDRVEWVFWEKIMLKMGFCQKWVALVSMCIKSVTYSILLNGQPHGLITPSRGLRQGDPFSPYLFLMVTEGLHALLRKAEENGNIKGVSLCVAGPRVSHLLFPDDSLVFCRATIVECVQIQSLLFMYEQASGQSINRGKTSIFF
ncbi:uncharacterized protein LOC142634918 [Castanea sativa]|uniref:uncharacterized protein LOC142634918 n=1 Tax=Castanea sativa TaxID=21020 RepID=UPI003F64C214